MSLNPSRRWSTHVSATRGLQDASLSGFSDLSYLITPVWRLHLLGTYQNSQVSVTAMLRIAIARMIGNQEASIIWSQSIHRLQFEFSAMRF